MTTDADEGEIRETKFDTMLKQLKNDCAIMGFVRLPVLVKLLGVSKTTIYKEIREGRFPKQVRLSPRVSAWRIADLKAHFERLQNEPSK